MRENLARVKKLIAAQMEARCSTRKIESFLLSKGLSQLLVNEFALQIPSKEEWLGTLHAFLAEKIRTCPGFHLASAPKFVAIVGASGVGKTTLILKLAHHYAKTKRVALLSIDDEKGGAYQQLEKYSSYWNIPLFSRMEEINGGYDLILVDTSGCNTYEAGRIEKMAALLSRLPSCEVHLALSAAVKEVDLFGTVHQFSSLNPASLIFTKLDETLASGAIVNLSSKVDIPISFVAYGYPLPGRVEIANPHEIAHKILTDLNNQEFQFIRTLSSSSLS